MPVHLIRAYNQYDPRLVWRVIDLVKALNIDILHAHEVKSDVIAFLASRLHHVPIMTTLHGWIGNSHKQRLFTAIDRRIARRFDRVIVVSGQIRDEMSADGIPAGNLRLLHNAIVVERYRRTGQQGFLEGLVGRPLPRPIISSIGRLSPEKGHADLIAALAMLAGRGRHVSTVFAGDGPSRGDLAEQVKRAGLEDWVHFPGYVSEPARVLEETDLMVLPSHTEGLPNAALEALMMDVPVLATRVGGTPEIISDGETGRLVPGRSPKALADAIDDFLTDSSRWKAMAQRGRSLVENEFNFHRRTRRLEAIYAELADRAGR